MEQNERGKNSYEEVKSQNIIIIIIIIISWAMFIKNINGLLSTQTIDIIKFRNMTLIRKYLWSVVRVTTSGAQQMTGSLFYLFIIPCFIHSTIEKAGWVLQLPYYLLEFKTKQKTKFILLTSIYDNAFSWAAYFV